MRREKSSKKGLNNRVNERPKSPYVRAPLPVRTHSGFSFEKRLMRISLQNRVVSFRCVCLCWNVDFGDYKPSSTKKCLCQSSFQPLSLNIWTSSIINLPSLYFWLFSYACSYFHPRVVLQRWQKISATWCSPVRRTLCSAGPEPILTTESNRYALPCEPWKLFEIRLTWEARWARQCTQLYVFCSSSKYSWNRRRLCAPWPPAPTFLRRCRHPPNNLTRLLQITPKIFTVSRVILDFGWVERLRSGHNGRWVWIIYLLIVAW